MSQVQSADFQQLTNVTVTGAVETLVGVSAAAAVESPTVKCCVKVTLVIAPGASTTSVTIKIYRGVAITGPLVGVNIAQGGGVTPGSPMTLAMVAADALNNAGQAQYCCSVTQTAATGNGTVVIGSIETMVLSG
jgi:hypothetical protein